MQMAILCYSCECGFVFIQVMAMSYSYQRSEEDSVLVDGIKNAMWGSREKKPVGQMHINLYVNMIKLLCK